MGRKVVLILGNGFTIDFVSYLSQYEAAAKKINVGNIFADGAVLRWPLDNRPGFLSYKNSPHLWAIGARSYLDSKATNEILERVVTCANVYSMRKIESMGDKTGNGFLHAYKELVSYLKYLFIHYNSLIPNLPSLVANWPWMKFFNQLNADSDVEEVVIVSYNYDIWLERLLGMAGIRFGIPLLDRIDDCKFHLFKPHGSISYLHRKSLPKDSFSINYNSFFLDCSVSDMVVSYEDLDRHTPVSFIIPPAGEAGRSSSTWAQSIRSECKSKLESFGEDDLAIVCGLSYWHVDRAEIDTLLNAMNSGMNVVHLNPYPSQTLDAVLNSLFSKYTHLSASELLEGYPV